MPVGGLTWQYVPNVDPKKVQEQKPIVADQSKQGQTSGIMDFGETSTSGDSLVLSGKSQGASVVTNTSVPGQVPADASVAEGSKIFAKETQSASALSTAEANLNASKAVDKSLQDSLTSLQNEKSAVISAISSLNASKRAVVSNRTSMQGRITSLTATNKSITTQISQLEANKGNRAATSDLNAVRDIVGGAAATVSVREHALTSVELKDLSIADQIVMLEKTIEANNAEIEKLGIAINDTYPEEEKIDAKIPAEEAKLIPFDVQISAKQVEIDVHAPKTTELQGIYDKANQVHNTDLAEKQQAETKKLFSIGSLSSSGAKPKENISFGALTVRAA